jgi:serine/threonine-protein kinase HipA
MSKTIARVFYRDQLAGQLEKASGSHTVTFTYCEDYLQRGHPIAYRLPLQQAPFVTDGLHPFFDSMVSEGWLRKQQAQRQKIDPNNRFQLLVNHGEDLPGVVSVRLTKSDDL